MKDPLKVLYLARWYPNRYDPMPGLFIQRHAAAAAQCCRIGVVYTHVVDDKKIRGYELDFSIEQDVPTARVYYSNPTARIPGITAIVKANRFLRANRAGIRRVKRELGQFDLTHVHVLTRLGVLALWMKWVKGTPYLISEHWSRYLPKTGDFNGWLRKYLTRLVVKHAEMVTTVTQNLAMAMQAHGLKNAGYRVLPNVVSRDFLQRAPTTRTRGERKTLLHVSCFEDKSKNISGMLRVIRDLSEDRGDFYLKLVGDGMDFQAMKSYAATLGLDDSRVVFTGLLEGKALVEEMASADLLVVFSNYENLPVVINESLVIGVPVIATSVGGIPELVEDGNGILVEPGNEMELKQKLTEFLDGRPHFDHQSLSGKYSKAYAPETIGRMLCSWYNAICEKKEKQ